MKIRLRKLHQVFALGVISAAFLVPAFAQPIAVYEAHTQIVPKERVLDAVVEAVHETTVSAQTSGTVISIFFDVNDYVTKGTVLLKFRDSEQRSELERAEAALSEASARSSEANAAYKRAAKVFDQGLVSKSAMDKATAERSSANARLEAAQAVVSRAKDQLSYTVVRAPYSGIVTSRHVQLGESANVGRPLMTGISLDDLRVAADVPQDMVNMVRASGKAQVSIPGMQTAVKAERLTFFPYANPSTHTFRVRAYLPAGTEGLYPGMFVKMRFKIGERERLVLPSRSVVRRGEMRGVYIVEDDEQVRLRLIRVGRVHALKGSDDGAVEVLSGLMEGEKVALDPIQAGVKRKEGEQEQAQ